MSEFLRKLFVAFETVRSDEKGATAVEYGLIVALIAAVIILAVQAVGVDVLGAFQDVADAL